MIDKQTQAKPARDAIAEGLKQGVLSFGELSRSAKRIFDLKQRILTTPLPEQKEIKEVVGCKTHQELIKSLTTI